MGLPNDLPFTREQVPEGSSASNTTNEPCRRPAGTSRGLSARRGAAVCSSECNGLLDRLTRIDASGSLGPTTEMQSEELTDLTLMFNGIGKLCEGNASVRFVRLRLDVDDASLETVRGSCGANRSNRLFESATRFGQSQLVDGGGHVDELELSQAIEQVKVLREGSRRRGGAQSKNAIDEDAEVDGGRGGEVGVLLITSGALIGLELDEIHVPVVAGEDYVVHFDGAVGRIRVDVWQRCIAERELWNEHGMKTMAEVF